MIHVLWATVALCAIGTFGAIAWMRLVKHHELTSAQVAILEGMQDQFREGAEHVKTISDMLVERVKGLEQRVEVIDNRTAGEGSYITQGKRRVL